MYDENLCLIFFLLISLFTFNTTKAQWLYNQKVTFHSTGIELIDFQVAVNLDNQNFNYSLAKSDGSDIRFSTDSTFNFSSDIPYWIEKWDISGISIIWIKVPFIPNSGDTSIYMFYGNNSAQSSSDPISVFELFDDFTDTDLDASKWDEFGQGSYTVQDSYIRFIQDNVDWDKGIITKDSLSLKSYKIKARYRLLNNSSNFQIQYNISNIPGSWHLRSGMTSSFDGDFQRMTVGYINSSGGQSNDSSMSYVFATNMWYTGETWFSGTRKHTIQDSFIISSNTNIYNNGFLTFCVYSRPASTPRVDVDWVFIRKYTQSDPLASLGSITVTAIEDEKHNIPSKAVLLQNYPNPFNPTTTIEFTIPKSAFVTLKIYNLLGQEIITLVSKRLASGRHRYDVNSKNLASGVYLYEIQTREFIEMKKMILLK